MKNKILLFLLLISITKLYSENALIVHLNNQILENTVPEFKEFNEKIRKLFQTQNQEEKERMVQEIKDFADKLISNLKNRLNSDKELTLAQKKSIQEVIYKIEEKLKKLT